MGTMRTWQYFEPRNPAENDWAPVAVTVTDADILRDYFGHWSIIMRQAGKGDQVSEESCILDFVANQWAVELPPDHLADALEAKFE